MVTCCGAIFVLIDVSRKEGDNTILHTIRRRRCGRKISRYFKVIFDKKSFYAHKEEGDAGLIQIFGLCKDCALKSPDIFTKKYKIPKSVRDAEDLYRSFNMRVDHIDTRQIFGFLAEAVSVEECDIEEEMRLERQRQFSIIKSQLKAVALNMEQTMHISDPGIWRWIFDEAINELIVEGVMNG